MLKLQALLRLSLIGLMIAAISACTWVRPDDGAEGVMLISEEQASECERLGSVEVSVMARVIGMDRHDEEVASDLRTLARNHAVDRGGDAIAPLSDIEQGKQRFGIYDCDGAEADIDELDEDEEDGVTVQGYDG